LSPSRRRSQQLCISVITLAAAVACAPPGGAPAGSGGAIHLADRLAGAEAACGEAPEATRRTMAWEFSEPQPAWRALGTETRPAMASVDLGAAPDGVKLSLGRPRSPAEPLLLGGVAIDLEGLRLADWREVRVRARTRERFAGLTVGYNLDEEHAIPGPFVFFASAGNAPPIFNDGSTQTYAIPIEPREGSDASTPLRSLAVVFGAPGPATLDLLAIELVARGSSFPEPCAARTVTRAGETRTSLYAHAPARVRYELDIPAGGRLDTGMSALDGDTPTFRVVVKPSDGGEKTLLDETVATAEGWQQRSVDLAEFAGRRVALTLEVASEQPGAVGIWGAPIVSAPAAASRSAASRRPPNIVLYVIDGGGRDFMSVYGYNRRTTPFLERLAPESVLFEHSFSNSTWTQPSTASFMTSLQHSVLGGLRRGIHSTPIPAAAPTLIERLRAAGYQTSSFTTNPNAGRMIGLERGVDMMQDTETEHHSTSSHELQERFWRFRDLYPGGPWFVHFQTTDVHEPNEPVPPYSGLYVSPAEHRRLAELDNELWNAAIRNNLFGTRSIVDFYDEAMAAAGIDRQEYFNLRRGLYDETMAFQDDELRDFVDRLKARGEWENTILVIGADHGHPAGTFARWGRGLFEPQPDPWEGGLLDSYATGVPMIFVWPDGIRGGRRITEAVSMIDVLPTLLDLAGLPAPEVAQGQSLAPLLRGHAMEVRPAVLDEFRVDEATGELIGNLDIIDGRWGASLEIGPQPEGADPLLGRHMVPVGGRWGALHRYFPEAPRLLLYDIWNDPFARKAVNEAHPELVDRYRRELVALWRANEALGKRFAGETGDLSLDPEQLQQLKALGYIQ